MELLVPRRREGRETIGRNSAGLGLPELGQLLEIRDIGRNCTGFGNFNSFDTHRFPDFSWSRRCSGYSSYFSFS